MNSVALIGRLTRDPEIRYTNEQMAIATFSIAIDRPPRRDGTRETDFPRITVFGRQAENCEKYLRKGRLVGITGRIQTGSYTNRDGQKVYTTDVVADRVEFIDWGDRENGQGGPAPYNQDRGQGSFNQDQRPASFNQDPGYGQPQGYGQAPQQAPMGQQRSQQPAQQPGIPIGFEAIDDEDFPF